MKCVCTSRAQKKTVIHAADVALAPLCGQTNATKDETWQEDIGPVNCWRCLRLLRQIDTAAAVERLTS